MEKKHKEKVARRRYALCKEKAKDMAHMGDDKAAQRLIEALGDLYRRSGDFIDKKAYDGARAGAEEGRQLALLGASSSLISTNVGLDNFEIFDNITKKVLLARDDDPVLTVALPIYESGPMAWVSFQGLAGQKNVEFSWELIIVEEKACKQKGKRLLQEYVEKLKKVRCSKIIYIELEEWASLFQKWDLIHKHSSTHSSKVLVLQAAHCFSKPDMLSETYRVFEEQSPFNVPIGTLALPGSVLNKMHQIEQEDADK